MGLKRGAAARVVLACTHKLYFYRRTRRIGRLQRMKLSLPVLLAYRPHSLT